MSVAAGQDVIHSLVSAAEVVTKVVKTIPRITNGVQVFVSLKTNETEVFVVRVKEDLVHFGQLVHVVRVVVFESVAILVEQELD